SADMAGTQDLERRINGRHRYDSVSRVRQNGIAARSQHPFCGNRKDCWAHILFRRLMLSCRALFLTVFSSTRAKASKKCLSFGDERELTNWRGLSNRPPHSA